MKPQGPVTEAKIQTLTVMKELAERQHKLSIASKAGFDEFRMRIKFLEDKEKDMRVKVANHEKEMRRMWRLLYCTWGVGLLILLSWRLL